MVPDAVHRGKEEPLTPGRASRLAEKRGGCLQPNKKIVGVLLVVAIGQVIGWGTIGLLAVVGRQVAADLHMDISAVFAGNSTFLRCYGLVRSLFGKAVSPDLVPGA